MSYNWWCDFNKKVLLRERKRHTARHVASARYADLSGGGRYPISGPGGVPRPMSRAHVQGGTPSQVGGGVPHPRSREVTPSQGGGYLG